MRFGFTAPLERRDGCDASTFYRAPSIPGGIGDVTSGSSVGSSGEGPIAIYYIRKTGEGAFRNVPAPILTLRAFVP